MPTKTSQLSSVLRVLLIEDDEADVFLVNEILKGGRARSAVPEFEMVVAETLAAGLEALDAGPIDVILLDLMLPDSRGMDSLRRVVAKAKTTPVVVLSNMNDEHLSIEAAENGAQDYLVKGHVESMWLARIMRYAVARKAAIQGLQKEVAEAREGASPGYRAALDLVQDPVFLFETDGRLRHANAAASAIAGDLAGRSARECFERLGVGGPDGSPLPDEALPHRACQAGRPWESEVTVRRSGDAPRTARLQATRASEAGADVVACALRFPPPPTAQTAR